MSRFIILDDNNKVIGIRYGLSIVVNETESDVGEIGQIKQVDGTFTTPETVPIEPSETVEQKFARLESMNTMINEDFAGLIQALEEKGSL